MLNSSIQIAGHQPLEELPVMFEEDIFDYISFEWKEPIERSW